MTFLALSLISGACYHLWIAHISNSKSGIESRLNNSIITPVATSESSSFLSFFLSFFFLSNLGGELGCAEFCFTWDASSRSYFVTSLQESANDAWSNEASASRHAHLGRRWLKLRRTHSSLYLLPRVVDSLNIGSSSSTVLECQPICTRYTNATHHRLRKGIGPASLPMSSFRHIVHTSYKLHTRKCNSRWTNTSVKSSTLSNLPWFLA